MGILRFLRYSAPALVAIAGLPAACTPEPLASPATQPPTYPQSSLPSPDHSPSPTPRATPLVSGPSPSSVASEYPSQTPGPVARTVFPHQRSPSLDSLLALFPDLPPTTELIYTDVNGDQEDDLVLFGGRRCAVLLWDGDHYSGPFTLSLEAWHPPSAGIAGLRLELRDWTGDSVPELVIDALLTRGVGTGLYLLAWRRVINHCAPTECYAVWEGTLRSHLLDFNYQGLCIDSTAVTPETDSRGRAAIRIVRRSMSIYGCVTSTPDEDPFSFSHLRHAESQVETLVWAGSAFELAETEIASLAVDIADQAQLFARGSDGILAHVQVRPREAEGDVWAPNDACQLYSNGEEIGPNFDCRGHFTRVEWRDIVGDEEQELVVQALSGAIPGAIGQYNGACVHQHLFAYQQLGAALVEIANVIGCVVRDDLLGVAITDYDADGALEILAGESVFGRGSTCPYPDEDGPILAAPPVYTECGYAEYGPTMTVYEWNSIRFEPAP